MKQSEKRSKKSKLSFVEQIVASKRDAERDMRAAGIL